jgi:hypothetical protein
VYVCMCGSDSNWTMLFIMTSDNEIIESSQPAHTQDTRGVEGVSRDGGSMQPSQAGQAQRPGHAGGRKEG